MHVDVHKEKRNPQLLLTDFFAPPLLGGAVETRDLYESCFMLRTEHYKYKRTHNFLQRSVQLLFLIGKASKSAYERKLWRKLALGAHASTSLSARLQSCWNCSDRFAYNLGGSFEEIAGLARHFARIWCKTVLLHFLLTATLLMVLFNDRNGWWIHEGIILVLISFASNTTTGYVSELRINNFRPQRTYQKV